LDQYFVSAIDHKSVSRANSMSLKDIPGHVPWLIAMYYHRSTLKRPPHRRLLVRFGTFEVDLEERVLRKGGMHIRLQSQPFQVLATLLENPGQPVTRELLRSRIWSEDTFVDFEHGLNAAVTRLRQALSDSAAKPRYIETLPRYGYRFIGLAQCLPVDLSAETAPVLTSAVKRATPFVVTAMALVIALAVSFPRIMQSPQVERGQTGHPVPLTTFLGQETHPALSRDGQVAFAWNGGKHKNFDIYVLRIGSATPMQLTSDAADDLSPTWSPNGNSIAFVRRTGFNRGELLLVPSGGGPEHKVHEIHDQELRDSPVRLLSLAWSPDGRWIAAAHRAPEDTAERIYRFSVSGEALPLTVNPSPFGDHTPAFSPDGRSLAFSKLFGFSSSEIALLPLHADLWPAGAVRHLTRGRPWSVKPAWTLDGNSILYLGATSAGSSHQMKVVPVSSNETITSTLSLPDDVGEFALGTRLVYSRQIHDTDILRAPIPASDVGAASGDVFISSTWSDAKPRYSPDGEKVAFTSARSGTPEIWVSKSDGSHPNRITSFGGALIGWASWSPDSQWLLFHARPKGQADVFAIPAAGGDAKRLTTNPSDDYLPSYSRDGHWINFCSTASGREDIWRMPAAGGEAVQLTNSGGCVPIESADGKSIIYLSADGNSIRSIPVNGGKSSTLVSPLDDYIKALAVTANGIYYPARLSPTGERHIWFFRFSTGTSRPIIEVNSPFGITVSPDLKSILFDDVSTNASDLMLLDNFQIR
jgi:Tol biopolymer transport system component/DNA-binding winged helix-turn-helix (wHTH) protein